MLRLGSLFICCARYSDTAIRGDLQINGMCTADLLPGF
jgi:hypothetical protein